MSDCRLKRDEEGRGGQERSLFKGWRGAWPAWHHELLCKFAWVFVRCSLVGSPPYPNENSCTRKHGKRGMHM
jgi:hypothetical protein